MDGGPQESPPRSPALHAQSGMWGPRITGPRLCPCKKNKNLKKQNEKRKKAWNFMAPERRVSCREYRGRTLLWWTSMHHKLQTTDYRGYHAHAASAWLWLPFDFSIITYYNYKQNVQKNNKEKKEKKGNECLRLLVAFFFCVTKMKAPATLKPLLLIITNTGGGHKAYTPV